MEPATAPPARPVAVVETDLFCEACGFNLYTQRVTRDDRLGLLVVRCPECGAYQSAHLQVTAGQKWLQRLALFGALAWAGVCVSFVIGMVLLFIGLTALADDGLTRRTLETLDGRVVRPEFRPGQGRTTVRFLVDMVEVPESQVREVTRFRPEVVPSGGLLLGRSGQMFVAVLGISVGAAAVVFAGGAAFSSACWFWRPGRRFVWLASPVLAYVLVQVLRVSGGNHSYSHYGANLVTDDSLNRIVDVGVLCVSLVVTAAGLIWGRVAARGLLTLFVPPGPRQLFAFLWYCDGRPFPLNAPSAPAMPARAVPAVAARDAPDGHL